MVVKQGNTITDIVLNSTGSIQDWQTILNNNGISTWCPVLIVGQNINTTDIVQNNFYNYLQTYPAVNNSEQSIIVDINILKTILDYSIINTHEEPDSIIENIDLLSVKEGETITDITLNNTGSVFNWENILNSNNFETWTPTLTSNLKYKTSYNQLQNNNLRYFQNYPATNNVNITDLNLQIDQILAIFENQLNKEFEDLELFDFEDGITYNFEN